MDSSKYSSIALPFSWHNTYPKPQLPNQLQRQTRCVISQQKCVQFLLFVPVLSNLWTGPVLCDFPLQNFVFSELKKPEYRANCSASSLAHIYIRAVLLALLLCYVTAATNCTETFKGLTDSSELQYKGHRKVFCRPIAF